MNSAQFLTFIFLLVFAFVSTFANAKKGKCVPFQDPSPFTIYSGYTVPVCETVLREAGVKAYWVDEDSLPQTDKNGSCYNDMKWSVDSSVAIIVNSFELLVPSPRCQNVILSSFCFINFRPCDPEIDVTDFITEEKACSWVCQIFRDEIVTISPPNNKDGFFCTKADYDWFVLNNLHILELLNLLPTLQCDNVDIFSPQEPCSAPAFVKPAAIAGHCEAYSGDYCSSVFPPGTMIYVSPGNSQVRTEKLITETAYVYNTIPPQGLCMESLVRYLCQSVFQECIDIGVSTAAEDLVTGFQDVTATVYPTQVAVGLKPPLSTCRSFVDECSDTPFFRTKTATPGAPLLDCANSYLYNPSACFLTPLDAKSRPVTLLPIPENNYMFNTKSFFDQYEYELNYFDGPNNTVFWGNSFAASQALSVGSIPLTNECASPLIIDYSSVPTNIFQGRCTFPCPTPNYTERERNSITIASWVFVVCSLVFSGLLSINFLIFKSQRHKKILFWFTLSYFGAVFMMFLALCVNKNGSIWEKQCATATQYEHNSGFALFQALFLTYFLLSASCWWCMQAVDLFQRLILGLQFRRGSSSTKRRTIAMHVFCWGIPLICVAAIITGGQFGYDSYLPFAFITQDQKLTSHAIYLQYIFFFAPILVLAAITYTAVAIVLIYLIKYDSTGGLKKFQDEIEKSKSFWFKLTQALKLFGFALLMLVFIIILIIHQVTVANNSDKWQNALRTWGENLASQSTSQTTVSDRFSPGLIILATFGFTSPGFFMFILYFICSSEVYGLWAGIFYYKLGVTWFKSIARQDIVTGSGSGSGSSHGSSQGSSTGKKGTNTISTDLLTGGGETALTGRRVESNTSKPHSEPSVAAPAIATSIPRSTKSQQQKEQVERRGTLFKGFTKNKMKEPTSVSTQPYDSGNGVELSSFGADSLNDRSAEHPQQAGHGISPSPFSPPHENIAEEPPELSAE